MTGGEASESLIELWGIVGTMGEMVLGSRVIGPGDTLEIVSTMGGVDARRGAGEVLNSG